MVWNPWHGCHKYSAGCAHCYVYRRDGSVGRDASQVAKTASFDLPVRKDRKGAWKIPPGETVYAVMTSDFFLEEADGWRPEIWEMMKARPDLQFVIITKRILRFKECLPDDWGDGYENVEVGCTCENGEEAARRLRSSSPSRFKSGLSSPSRSLARSCWNPGCKRGRFPQSPPGERAAKGQGSATTTGCWTSGTSAPGAGCGSTSSRPASISGRTGGCTPSPAGSRWSRRGRRGLTSPERAYPLQRCNRRCLRSYEATGSIRSLGSSPF